MLALLVLKYLLEKAWRDLRERVGRFKVVLRLEFVWRVIEFKSSVCMYVI